MKVDETVPRNRKTTWLLSSVGGGPLERLAAGMQAIGRPARLVSLFDATTWRRLTSAGTIPRALARLRAMCIYPLHALGLLAFASGEVVVASTNPFFLPVLLVATRWLHRKRIVALIYDLYPDALEGAGLTKPGGLASRLGEAANRVLFRRADGVVFIGQRMGTHARRRYGEPRRWIVLETGADPGEFQVPDREQLAGQEIRTWCGDSLLLAYVGNFGPLHDWETTAEGIEALARGPMASRVRFLVVASGSGMDRLQERLHHAHEIVRFQEQLPDSDWVAVMQRVDVAIVTLRRSAAHTSVPSKTFSAMAAGSAILAVAPDQSDLAEIVRESACGALVEPGDAAGFERAVLALQRDPLALSTFRASSLRAIHDRYGIPALARRWDAFLERVIGNLP